MELSPDLVGITKKILNGAPGTGNIDLINYPKETKFTFHYQIRLTDYDRTIIDDTRNYKKTMELYTGKKFQLEVWELCLESMAVGEVSSFVVDVKYLQSFGPVNKKLRDYMLGKHEKGEVKHCCGMMAMKEQGGLGYPDLDKFLENPTPLEFVFELIKVERPDEIRKEYWIMDEKEKSDTIPKLREEGNAYFSEKKYDKAKDLYKDALGMLEQLCLKEKPGEPEWIEIEKKKVPFLINLSQTEINLGNFYEAITYLSNALNTDPTNTKALYRRAYANRSVWNLDEAKSDYMHALTLNPSMSDIISEELKLLEEMRKQKKQSEKELFSGKLFN